MNTTEERDQFIEEIKHQNRVLQSEKGRLSAAKRTYKGAQDKQVFVKNEEEKTMKFLSIIVWKFTLS